MFAEKIDELIAVLESEECESKNVSSQLYTELLAAYLYRDDLPNAQFLWRRIPRDIKLNNTEIDILWHIFIHLWNSDFVAFHKDIDQKWSDNIKEIMAALKERIYNEAIQLIGDAYVSIYEDKLCGMINKTVEDLPELCKTLKWEILDGPQPRLIIPKRAEIKGKSVNSAEYQLAQLTDFVSFLEN